MGFLQRANENCISADSYTFPGWNSVALPITRGAALTKPRHICWAMGRFSQAHPLSMGIRNLHFPNVHNRDWEINVCAGPKLCIPRGFSNERRNQSLRTLETAEIGQWRAQTRVVDRGKYPRCAKAHSIRGREKSSSDYERNRGCGAVGRRNHEGD